MIVELAVLLCLQAPVPGESGVLLSHPSADTRGIGASISRRHTAARSGPAGEGSSHLPGAWPACGR